MATASPFERSSEDINYGSKLSSLKRKSWNTSSSPGQYKQYLGESRLLGTVEKKRKRLIFPLENYPTHLHNGAFSSFRTPGPSNRKILDHPFSPKPFLSASRPRSEAPNPGGWYQFDSSATVLSTRTPYNPATLSGLRGIGEAVGIIQGLGMENALLRQEKEECDEKIRKLKQKEEQDSRDNLKMSLELQRYKQNVHSVQMSSNQRSQGLKFFGGQEPRSTFDTSVSRELLDITHDASIPSLLSAGESSGPGHHSLIDGERQPVWKELYDKANDPSKVDKMKALKRDIELQELKLKNLKITQPKSRAKPVEDKTLTGAFTPLSDEAEEAVKRALGCGDRLEVLAMHENSNIDVTRVVLQCLLPGAWLNDEVINVYMDLLKERESREPERFLKCHFFNTFFYNKLYKDKRTYDYKAIRRWTTQRKLGYSLSACDKILVPIHQDIHWCLAVINIHDKKLEYLDSLKGGDGAVLDVLSRYIADEVKDKDGKNLDVSTWEHDFPKDIPEQKNGCDCGMFMVKYADFHSRGAPLNFGQEHMEYFRKKMVLEILELKAT